MITDGEKITAWLTANLSLASVQQWASGVQSALGVLVPLGQFCVAVVTVVYIWKKIVATKRGVQGKRGKRGHRGQKGDE